MKTKRIRLTYGKEKFEINLRVCGFFKKAFGLMFTPREKARALLFDFPNPTRMAITAWFVFFPFVAIWLDENGKIMSVKTVKPFKSSLRPNEKFSKLIEIPINSKYSRIVKNLVGDRKL